MFADLCARLSCASNFDGNPYDVLSVAMMSDYGEYILAETPTSIGLHEAHYTVVFRPGECVCQLLNWRCALPLSAILLQVWIIVRGSVKTRSWRMSTVLVTLEKKSTMGAGGRRLV